MQSRQTITYSRDSIRIWWRSDSKVETYKLNRKGEILKGNERITQISQKDLCNIYSHAETLGEPFNMPGNTFSFIRIITNEGVTYYCWDRITVLPVTNMYLKLNNLLQK
jgi:hypothetical protein